MAESLLTLEILGVEGLLFKAEAVRSLTVRLEDGSFIGIRPGHAPLTAMAAEAPIRYLQQDAWHQAETNAGILTVNQNLVRILTTAGG